MTAVVLAVVVAVLPACGGNEEPAQPAPDVTVFTEGDFDEIPRYPRSDDLSEKQVEDGVVTQSFVASGARPAQVLDFYAERLPGRDWMPVRDPDVIGTDTRRAVWTRGDRQLVISATEAPAVDGEDPSTQYSLSLEPAGRPLPERNPG